MLVEKKKRISEPGFHARHCFLRPDDRDRNAANPTTGIGSGYIQRIT
jgi:hypothetical protein